MTAGSKTIDERQSFVDYFGYVVKHGRIRTRNWVGVDWSSSAKPSYTNVYTPGAYHPRRIYNKPPKRQLNEEHAYQCAFGDDTRDKLSYTFTGPPGSIPNTIAVNLIPQPTVVLTHLWTSNDDAKLLGKLREKIVGSDFNAGVTLAESSKSFGTIANSATKIYLALKALKSGRPGDASRILVRNTAREGKFKPPREAQNTRSALGSHWLELQYGWLPLLKDAEGAAQAIAQAFSVPPQKTYRASIRKADLVSPVAGFTGSSVAYTRGTIKATIREKNMPQLLGLMDPASIAWELMPYSFVADWFIPIGSYLHNLALARGVEGTFVTTKFRYSRHAYWSMSAPNWPVYLPKPCRFLVVSGDVNRTVSTSLAVPMPSFVSLSTALSPKRCLNAISLLTQLKWSD